MRIILFAYLFQPINRFKLKSVSFSPVLLEEINLACNNNNLQGEFFKVKRKQLLSRVCRTLPAPCSTESVAPVIPHR